MKKILAIAVFLISSTSLFAQNYTGKTTIVGVNPFGLLVGLYSGSVGAIINDGGNEMLFHGSYWSPPEPFDDLILISAGSQFRFYNAKNGKGFFYSGTADAMYVNWDYKDSAYDLDFNIVETEESITGIIISPGLNIGYRWTWNSGFTLAPTIGAAYSLGEIKASDGTLPDMKFDGFGINVGLGLGFMF